MNDINIVRKKKFNNPISSLNPTPPSVRAYGMVMVMHVENKNDENSNN